MRALSLTIVLFAAVVSAVFTALVASGGDADQDDAAVTTS